jgi:nucleotide-binding universal stress UspA family protein
MDLKETTVTVSIQGTNGQQPASVETRLNSNRNIPVALAAVDGSPASNAAVSVAMQIAGKSSVAVRGLYIVDERLITNPYANFQRELGSRAEPDSSADLVSLFQQRGNHTLQWLADHCRTAQVPVSTEIFFGGVSELVLKKAEQAQLLVLGRRGWGHMADPKHLGRNYRTIARRARIPLLIGGSQQGPIKRILLAYNNSAGSNRALAWAISFQQITMCQLTVLAVAQDSSPSQGRMASIQEQLDRRRLRKYRLIGRVGRPADQIVAVAAEDQADLIVMGRGSHAAWLKRLTGSTVDRTLRNTDLPVLVA